MTTEAQARAIAEALGWESESLHEYMVRGWSHPLYKLEDQYSVPRLTADTTLGRAMCYDAIQWLLARDNWRVSRPFTAAALEAAMMQELGI